jgi:hypothetical protein
LRFEEDDDSAEEEEPLLREEGEAASVWSLTISAK